MRHLFQWTNTILNDHNFNRLISCSNQNCVWQICMVESHTHTLYPIIHDFASMDFEYIIHDEYVLWWLSFIKQNVLHKICVCECKNHVANRSWFIVCWIDWGFAIYNKNLINTDCWWDHRVQNVYAIIWVNWWIYIVENNCAIEHIASMLIFSIAVVAQ